MKIQGFLKDVGGASRVTKTRQTKFDKASPLPSPYDPIGATAKALHPGLMELKLEEIKVASKSAKTFVFSADKLPRFRAGQFLTLILQIGDSVFTRPYSICSAPYMVKEEHPIIEITVKKLRSAGFGADYLYDEAKVGDVFQSEIGLGQFYYEPLRDAPNVVALAGGSGITPFLSMAREIKHGTLDVNLTILYGSSNEDDIILKDELEACICDKVKVVHVLSGSNPGWDGEKGFLSAELIKKYSPEGDVSYFVCGPQALYDYAKAELEKLEIPERRARLEVYGSPKDITESPGFPVYLARKTFNLTVMRGIDETVISANANEPLAVALEKAGIKIHTSCRSGVCGFCRVKVLKGDYYVCPTGDGRRAADKDFGYVHSCMTYPLSDLTIKVNID